MDVEFKNYDSVTHEFFGMGAVLDESKAATKFAATNLMKAFNDASQRQPARAQGNK